MPEASDATKSRLDKFIRDCEQLNEIYAVEPLTYTDIMGEWWQRINDIIYALGLTYSGHPSKTGEDKATKVDIAWTIPELGKKRSDFFVEELPQWKTAAEAADKESARKSNVAGTGTTLVGTNTQKVKAHKFGLIQSVDKLFQRNVETWGPLYNYFYGKTHVINPNGPDTLRTPPQEPASLTEMIFGAQTLPESGQGSIDDIFGRACRNLTGNDQGLANSLAHFIEDVIGDNLYDFLDPYVKDSHGKHHGPNGLDELLFGTDENGDALTPAEMEEKWSEMENGGSSSDGIVGRTNEIVDTIGDELYDWLNEEDENGQPLHACGFTYNPNTKGTTRSFQDILFGSEDYTEWCKALEKLRTGGLLDELASMVDYLGEEYKRFVDQQNHDKDPDDVYNPAHDDNPDHVEYDPNENPLYVLEQLKDGQVLYGDVDQETNILSYKGDWILTPGNICENQYEYNQVLKAQNDQEAIFNTFERVSYDSTGGLYNTGTDNAANGAVYMYTYPRDIEITKVDENNVKVACTLGPTESFDTKIATYNDQFEVVNGIPSLKKLYVLPETTMSTANAEKTYGTVGNPFYKKSMYHWIMLPFETKAEMETYNSFNALITTPTAKRNAPFKFVKTCRCRNSYGNNGDRCYFFANKANSSDGQVMVQLPEVLTTLTLDVKSKKNVVNANILTSKPQYKNCCCTKAYVGGGMTYGSNVYWYEGCDIQFKTYASASDQYSSITLTGSNDADLYQIVINPKSITYNWTAGAKAAKGSRCADGSLLVTQTMSDDTTTTAVYPRNATFTNDENAKKYTITWNIVKCIYVWDFVGYYGSIVTPDNNTYKNWWYYAMPSTDSTMDSFLSRAGIQKSSWSYANPQEMTSWNLDKKNNIVDIGTNSITYLGFLSNKKYGQYYFTTTPNSDTNDDDVTGIIIGGYKNYSTGTYPSLALNRSHNNLSLTLYRYRFVGNSVSANLVAWNVNGSSSHTLVTGTVLKSGTYVMNGSVLNGTTYTFPTVLSSDMTINDNASSLYSGSVVATNSTFTKSIYKGRQCVLNGITVNEDTTINKQLFLISSPISNLNGRRGLYTRDDGTVIGAHGFVDMDSGMYGLKSSDTIKIGNTTYNLALRYPSTEQRYIDRYITTGPTARSDAENSSDIINKVGSIGTVSNAKNNGKTGKDSDGKDIEYKFNWTNVSLIVQKLLAAANAGKLIVVAGNLSNIGVGSETITKLNSAVLMACPFHLIGDSFDDWWNSISTPIRDSITNNMHSIYIVTNGTSVINDATVKKEIFKQKVWPLYELSSYSISSLTLDDIFKIANYTGNYWCADRGIKTGINSTANYIYIGQISGYGLINAYKRRGGNYYVIVDRQDSTEWNYNDNVDTQKKTYKTVLTYYDTYRNINTVAVNNRLLYGSTIKSGSKIAAGSQINGVHYSSTTTLNADLEVVNSNTSASTEAEKRAVVLAAGTVIAFGSKINNIEKRAAETLTAELRVTNTDSFLASGSKIAAGSQIHGVTNSSVRNVTSKLYLFSAVLAAGSNLKAGTYVAGNSVVNDTTLSARILTADTLIIRDAYAHLNNHYKYPGTLVISATTGIKLIQSNYVPVSVIGVTINGGFEQKIFFTRTDAPELYNILSSMTSYGYTCCSNPLTHFSGNKFVDINNSEIYVMETDTIYRLNSAKTGYNPIENAGVTDEIFKTYGTGKLISNDITNKVYFTRGDNNAVQKVVDSVKLGPGLVYGENNVINVDFSNMDKSDIEKMLKQIKVPIWLTGNKRFYVNKDTGNDYLGTDTSNAQYDGHSEDRGSKDYPFKTIQACVNYVSSTFNMYNRTATIVVSKGIYEENLSLGAYSSTTGGIEMEPWDGWWTTTIRVAGGQALNVNSGAKWTLRGFNIQSFYGVYQDTSNHYMSGVGTSSGSTFSSVANHFTVVGIKGLILQTLKGKTNVLRAGSVIAAGSYLRKGTTFTYQTIKDNEPVDVEFNADDHPIVTKTAYTLSLDWEPANNCILANGSVIKGHASKSDLQSVLCGRTYTAASTTLALDGTEHWHDLRCIATSVNGVIILNPISLTHNGLWLRSECSDPAKPHVMFHTLSNGCMLAAGSMIAKGSIVNETSYTRDTTLSENLSITKSSWLMPTSVIAKGSIITKNNYINKEKLDIQRTFETDTTLINTTHTLMPESSIAPLSYIAAGSIINGVRYEKAVTLDAADDPIAITITSQMNGGSILAPDSVIAGGSTWNNTTSFAAVEPISTTTDSYGRKLTIFQQIGSTGNYKILPQWKNNGFYARRGLFGGARVLHLEDDAMLRTSSNYTLPEYCRFTADVVFDPTGLNASGHHIEFLGVFSSQVYMKGGATYGTRFVPLTTTTQNGVTTESIDCRRFKITGVGMISLSRTGSNGMTICGTDCVIGSDNYMVENYVEANDNSTAIKASTPGIDGANTYSKKVDTYKISFVQADNTAVYMY